MDYFVTSFLVVCFGNTKNSNNNNIFCHFFVGHFDSSIKIASTLVQK